MIFSSILFLFIFLPITLFIYYLSPKKIKNFILLIASLIFYAWGEPTYVILMLFTIVFNYYMALVIESNKRKRKLALIITIAIDILILGFFKYFGLLVDTINSIFSLSIESPKLSLPVGISFYTFQTLSYVIDVYIKQVKVQKSLIDFGAYIAMFPQLVAGPIVKYSDIEKDLTKRKINMDNFGRGVERFILGLGKKVLIANNVGMIWESIQSRDLGSISVIASWIGIIAYTLQIYFDFSGYSDMAIGLGKMLGFNFMENFNYPYIATSITDFWRRWHISLSSWFRDYVYIPLGGNRCKISRQCINLLIVWSLTGLWHGASYNFIMWGLYYGVLLIFEKFIFKKILDKLPKLIRWLYSIILVMIGWVFFASSNLSWAIDYLKIMFGGTSNSFIDSSTSYYLSTNWVLLVIAIIIATPLLSKIFDYIKKQKEGGMLLAIIIQMAILIVSIAYLVNASYNPFLYFRF